MWNPWLRVFDAMYQTVIQQRIREQRILHDVTLELTYQCNLDCFYCYNDREKQGKPLSLGQYRQLLADLADMQTLFLMLTGGEPMVHPYFFDIGRAARDLGFVTRVRTNGHSLNRKQADRLKLEVDPYLVEVSLHGASPEVHDRQTRVEGSFVRLMKNIAHATDSGLKLSAVTTPTAWNEQQIEEMLSLCDGLGIPLRFQGPVAPRDNGDTTPMQIQPAPSTWDRVSTLVESRRSGKQPDLLQECVTADDPDRKADPALCGVGVAGVDIDPYGNVQACMHLQESAGNLHTQSIGQIWNESSLFQRARSRAVEAAMQFEHSAPSQYGAPVYCIAVEENAAKRACGDCGGCE